MLFLFVHVVAPSQSGHCRRTQPSSLFSLLLVISFSPMSLRRSECCQFTFVSPAWTFLSCTPTISNCLVNISTWMWHLKLHLWSWTAPPESGSSRCLFMPANGNAALPGAQVKTFQVSLTHLFLSHYTSSLQTLWVWSSKSIQNPATCHHPGQDTMISLLAPSPARPNWPSDLYMCPSSAFQLWPWPSWSCEACYGPNFMVR